MTESLVETAASSGQRVGGVLRVSDYHAILVTDDAPSAKAAVRILPLCSEAVVIGPDGGQVMIAQNVLQGRQDFDHATAKVQGARQQADDRVTLDPRPAAVAEARLAVTHGAAWSGPLRPLLMVGLAALAAWLTGPFSPLAGALHLEYAVIIAVTAAFVLFLGNTLRK